MKFQFVSSMAFFSGLFLGVPAMSQTTKPVKGKQPNIIFIIADDLGYGDIGVFFQKQRGRTNIRSEPSTFTPNLDNLAANGVTLLQHYCAAPVCAPSRASILLGVSQGHANVRDNQFDKALEENYTMGNMLQKAGYVTAAFGKWGLQGGKKGELISDNWPAHPLDRGFDYYFGYIRHKDGHEHYPKEGIYDGPKEVWENHSEISKALDKCYTGDLWTAAAKKWIIDYEKEKKADRPFFIYLAYDTPHAILELPTQAYPTGGGINGGIQWLGEPGHMINTASGKVDTWIHPDYATATYDDDNNPLTPEVPWPDVNKRYATAIRRIDCGVGDIIKLLKDLQIDSNTLVVFTSDNGPSDESFYSADYPSITPEFFNSFGPFDGIKRDCWEGGVRVPAIASWPGQIPANTTAENPSISYDWLPTFTDVAGFPPPARADGVSLLPSLTGKGQQSNALVYVEYYENRATPGYKEFDPNHRNRRRNQMQLIRMGDYVGVRYDIKSQADKFEIYNVIKDAGEHYNLAVSHGELPEASSDKAVKNASQIIQLQKEMQEKVLQIRRPNSSAARPYDNELVPAVADKKVVQGINWKTFKSTFPWVPEVGTLKPGSTGLAVMPAVTLLKPDDNVLYCDGYLRIPQDGDYTFSLNVGGNALLRIHEATIIDADYGYNAGTERSGTIKLKTGLHPFRLYYKSMAGVKHMLNFQWQGPGIAIQSVPANVFFHD